MRANSLALRLFIWAAGWTLVILIVTGIALSTLYRHAVERAFDRRLDVYLRTLVADVASPEEGGDKFPQSIGEPLFELPLSGWYWQVTRLDCESTAGALLAIAVGLGVCRSSTAVHPPPTPSTGRAMRRAPRVRRFAWSNATSISATRAST